MARRKTTVPKIVLYVKILLTGEVVRMRQKLSVTTEIERVRGDLELLTGIPSDVQRLFYLDQADLLDESLLKDHDVVAGTYIHMDVWKMWRHLVKAALDNNVKEVLSLGVQDHPNNLPSTISDAMTPAVRKSWFAHRAFIALSVAVASGHEELVENLLEQECCWINRMTPYGRTLLHIAAAQTSCRTIIIKLLLEYGIDKTLKDIDGLTAADIACDIGIKKNRTTIRSYRAKARRFAIVSNLELLEMQVAIQKKVDKRKQREAMKLAELLRKKAESRGKRRKLLSWVNQAMPQEDAVKETAGPFGTDEKVQGFGHPNSLFLVGLGLGKFVREPTTSEVKIRAQKKGLTIRALRTSLLKPTPMLADGECNRQGLHVSGQLLSKRHDHRMILLGSHSETQMTMSPKLVNILREHYEAISNPSVAISFTSLSSMTSSDKLPVESTRDHPGSAKRPSETPRGKKPKSLSKSLRAHGPRGLRFSRRLPKVLEPVVPEIEERASKEPSALVEYFLSRKQKDEPEPVVGSTARNPIVITSATLLETPTGRMNLPTSDNFLQIPNGDESPSLDTFSMSDISSSSSEDKLDSIWKHLGS